MQRTDINKFMVIRRRNAMASYTDSKRISAPYADQSKYSAGWGRWYNKFNQRRIAMKFFLSAFLALIFAVTGLPSQGLTTTYRAYLDGPSEFPPNASPGTGFAQVVFDSTAHLLDINVTFSGLTGTTTATHIHAATALPGTGNAGVATQVPTFIGFPLGVTSGTYTHTFDTSLSSTWNPAYITAHGGTTAGAEAALGAALAAGTAYFNIHSTFSPGGEIRGFLAVPAPATILLFGTGLAGLAGIRLRRKKQ
jgi:hypothetical protein